MDVYPSMDSWRKQDMVKTSLLGVPHDDNSSFMKEGSLRISAANCNPRRAACGTKQASISARRAGLSLGDIPFDGISDPCDLIKQAVGDALDAGHHLISLGGDRAALAYGSSHAS